MEIVKVQGKSLAFNLGVRAWPPLDFCVTTDQVALKEINMTVLLE